MNAPSPTGDNWKSWGDTLKRYLDRFSIKLQSLTNNDSAAEDGILKWDRVNNRVVVSINGEWKQIPITDDLTP